MKQLGLLGAVLACCGVKLLVLAALVAPTGFLTDNLVVGVIGLAVAAAFIGFAVRSRHRCDGVCHVPRTESKTSDLKRGAH
ncbi:hypothetical protein [Geodermatophilus chilensis]|jgi:hypothetical protein|uniref:hypothetical protein n=1 Tax=Geodermatophilus chilensis TaxID=2035835 RepID=UPI000C25EC24|nr:hypothetical protein [Geodermatophilus chilensis]